MRPEVLLLFVLAVTPPSSAAPRPLVLSIGGIGVGSKSTDADVVRTFGTGCFAAEEPHGGGRYFTNPAQSLTLHIIVGVDNATEVIELREGRQVPKSCVGDAASQKLARSPRIEHGIRLGMSSAQVRRILGTPDEIKATGDRTVLVFRTSFQEDERVSLFYEASFGFTRDRLVAISLSDGE